MLTKLLDLTALVLGYYIIVTWSFLALSLCCSAMYVDLVLLQHYGKLLELGLCLKTRVLFLIPYFIVQCQLCLLWLYCLSVLLIPFIAPLLFQNQYGFMKGTGAQNCGTTIAFTATQTLNHQQECRIVSLDIKGAFDKIWWLSHFWSIGFRQKAYSLMESYVLI